MPAGLHTEPESMLIAFGDIDGDVNPFLSGVRLLAWSQCIETRVARDQIVAAQVSKVARQLLFLVFTIATTFTTALLAQLEMK